MTRTRSKTAAPSVGVCYFSIHPIGETRRLRERLQLQPLYELLPRGRPARIQRAPNSGANWPLEAALGALAFSPANQLQSTLISLAARFISSRLVLLHSFHLIASVRVCANFILAHSSHALNSRFSLLGASGIPARGILVAGTVAARSCN